MHILIAPASGLLGMSPARARPMADPASSVAAPACSTLRRFGDQLISLSPPIEPSAGTVGADLFTGAAQRQSALPAVVPPEVLVSSDAPSRRPGDPPPSGLPSTLQIRSACTRLPSATRVAQSAGADGE